MKTPDAHTGRELVVLHDEPTLPDLFDPPTLPDLRRRKPQRPQAPMWPIPQREQRPAARGRSPFGWVIATALGASAVLLLSVLSLLVVISLTGHTGIFAPSRPAGQSARGVSTASPPANPANPAPGSGWLQVAPASVQFGCSDHQRTQTVVLENHGLGPVHWQVSFSAPADQVGVAISPGNGDLGAGESTAIQLQNISQSARQGEVIRFSVTQAQAGPPASVSFTAVACG
jgi:hypothetical protein